MRVLVGTFPPPVFPSGFTWCQIYSCTKDFTTETHNQTICAMPTQVSNKLPPMSFTLNLQNVRAHNIIQRQQ